MAWLALLGVLGLAGCASRIERPAETHRGSADRSGGRRGNPPFYEVFGKRYYVLASSQDYDQRGVASWYGRKFHHQQTSSGEIYDMYAMTAAHKTLPLPTWVEVTDLDNGKHVVVKVNDRGPFVDDRLIDLSYAAAKALGMIRTGTARVEVRALAGRPTPAAHSVKVAGRPAATQASVDAGREAAASALAGQAPLFIQVGAFAKRSNARRLVLRLRTHGYSKTFMLDSGGDNLHRVRIGPLDGVSEYDRVTNGLHGLGLEDTNLVVGY